MKKDNFTIVLPSLNFGNEVSNIQTTSIKKYAYYASTKIFLFAIFALCFFQTHSQQNNNIILDNAAPYLINTASLGRTFIGGDTIFVASSRTKPIRFQYLLGSDSQPIVVININGQVKINDSTYWGGITFENCRYIKISGSGHPNFKYGFELGGNDCGLAFSDLSSDCEAEFIKIKHEGFFGIFAKKDYGGNPPVPHPVFDNLIIHDCFIENVSEGMYIGETKSPGMEFKGLKIYNNIVRNTKRESIQIANAVENVLVYNNTLINAGLEQLVYHTNNLQIGANSIVNAYNNIIISAPSFGIIALGKGNSNFSNNYISNSQGMFIDNRILSDTLSPIIINNNYFNNNTGAHVIRNMNELNQIDITYNKYNTNIPFYYNNSGNLNNFSLINNLFSEIHQINFKDPANNDYSLVDDTPLEYKILGAPSGPEFFDIIQESKQIIIEPSMVFDKVVGGSVVSPLYLFDEQNINMMANQHPVSTSWKPYWFWNTTNAPYHVVIDLGKDYHLTEIYFHDMHSTYEFTVEFGSENNWTPLLVEPCDKFNTWKTHITDVDTRYLRLSMYKSVFGAVNEILIYGYTKTISTGAQRTAETSMIATEKITMFPNPIDDSFQLNFPESLYGSYDIIVYDMNGNKVLKTSSEIDVKNPNKKFDKKMLKKFNKGWHTVFCKNKKSGSYQTINVYKK